MADIGTAIVEVAAILGAIIVLGLVVMWKAVDHIGKLMED
jgi:hypothetical protein